ncbi:MAG: polysaccharide deacetylase family protein [Actinomycetota bacterium]|nr:polysaccharide deacetylase family protein [Actinomycetota bacterium]
MSLARRDLLVALGGTAAGALATLGTEREVEAARDRVPLPFYGSAVSAVRPDQSRPSAAHGQVVWSGARDAGTKRLALTFDDGPDPAWTPRVLAALARHEVVATFFVRGDHLSAHPQVHADSLAAGHELADHSWDHPDLGRLTLAEVSNQLRRTDAAIEHLTGRRPTLMRPPYGHLTGSTVLAAAESGLTTVLWSTQVHEDRFTSHPDGLVGAIRAEVAPGDILLAHDSGSADRVITVDHLDAVLAGLRDDGYELVTVSQLLTASAGSSEVGRSS